MGGSMTKVLSGLYVGALDNTKNEEELMANGISRILVVQNEKYEIEKSPGRHYLQVVINEQDDRALMRCLPETNDFIHAARLTSDNVLVCSDSGMSASVAVVAAYLMSLYHLDSRSAVSVVQGLRHAANPVASLQDQLERFESSELTGNGVIGQSPARHPSGPSASELAGGSQPLTVAVEHARLIDKFGTWPRLDEDLQAIGIALKSHKTLSDSGFYLYDDPDDPSDPSMEPKQLSDQGDVPQSRSRPLVEDDKACRVQETIDIPRSDSLDPDRSSGTDTIGHSSAHLPSHPCLDPNDEGLFDSEPVFGDPVPAEAAPSPTALNESDPAHTNRNRMVNLTVPLSGSDGVDEGLEADEIGFELDEDAVAEEEDEDNDEVPGAVSIPIGSSARRSVAASYHHAGLSSRNTNHSRMGYSLASNTQYHTNVGSVTRSAYQPSVRNPTTVPINNTDPRLSTTAPLRRTFW